MIPALAYAGYVSAGLAGWPLHLSAEAKAEWVAGMTPVDRKGFPIS